MKEDYDIFTMTVKAPAPVPIVSRMAIISSRNLLSLILASSHCMIERGIKGLTTCYREHSLTFFLELWHLQQLSEQDYCTSQSLAIDALTWMVRLTQSSWVLGAEPSWVWLLLSWETIKEVKDCYAGAGSSTSPCSDHYMLISSYDL